VFISNATLGITTILLVFIIAYKYNEKVLKDNKQALIAGALGVSSYFIFLPTSGTFTINNKAEMISGIIETTNLGTGSLFVGIIVAFLSSALFTFLIKTNKFTIKMPKEVPPAVIKSFASIFPFLLTILPMALASVILDSVFGISANEIISAILSKPLQLVVGSLPGFLLIYGVMQTGAFFGIHMSWLQSITLMPVQLQFLQDNLDAINNGKEPVHILTTTFMNSFGMIGGGGHVLACVIAIFIFSKRKNHLAIAKIGGPVSLFNISEPVWLGFPLAFNPIMFIPYIFLPLITLTLSYIATITGIIPILAYDVPWTTPVFFQSFFGSGGNIIAGLWSLLMLAFSVLFYAPFIKAAARAEELEASYREGEE
jgi:PTS system cellobiose-specific IIC component